MGILGSIAGVGASIFGGIKASKAMKQVRRNYEQQQQENEAWYNRRYNEDATQRADVQRILTRTEDSIRNRNRQAAATQAVMGGTEESVAAAKAANNQALTEAASQIAAQAEARKDAIEQTYQQRDAAINESLNDMNRQKANNISSAADKAGQALSFLPI